MKPGSSLVEHGEGLVRKDEPAPRDVAFALAYLLMKVGSWTESKWGSHLRYEFGDTITDRVEAWLQERGVYPEVVGNMREVEFNAKVQELIRRGDSAGGA